MKTKIHAKVGRVHPSQLLAYVGGEKKSKTVMSFNPASLGLFYHLDKVHTGLVSNIKGW